MLNYLRKLVKFLNTRVRIFSNIVSFLIEVKMFLIYKLKRRLN